LNLVLSCKSRSLPTLCPPPTLESSIAALKKRLGDDARAGTRQRPALLSCLLLLAVKLNRGQGGVLEGTALAGFARGLESPPTGPVHRFPFEPLLVFWNAACDVE
jgi:hypothetical protein